MIQSPTARVLSTFLENKIQFLLIGGQACILYGGAEFSRDIDFAVMVSRKNLENLNNALSDLEAEQIYVPGLIEEVLLKGHACHFRCQNEDIKGFRIDIISVMRGVDDFEKLWLRRNEIELKGTGKVPVISLMDLVKSKKTQRDKDWPMIRRLIEADVSCSSAHPPEAKISFWLYECRTPELLITLASKYREKAVEMISRRPLLSPAIKGNIEETRKYLKEEEEKEIILDKAYWTPLKSELEKWRREKKMKKISC